MKIKILRVPKVKIGKQIEKTLFHPELSFPTDLKMAAFHSRDFLLKSVVSKLRYVPAVFPVSDGFPTDSIALGPRRACFRAIGFL